MIRPRARRDFILDTGAVIRFASDYVGFLHWLAAIESQYDEPIVLIPGPVLSECITGDDRIDFGINRVRSAIANQAAVRQSKPLLPTELTFARSGVLRTLAIAARPDGPKTRISPTDAQIVALAEERSLYGPVTIITGDPRDIRLLVEVTGARNIGVQAV